MDNEYTEAPVVFWFSLPLLLSREHWDILLLSGRRLRARRGCIGFALIVTANLSLPLSQRCGPRRLCLTDWGSSSSR